MTDTYVLRADRAAPFADWGHPVTSRYHFENYPVTVRAMFSDPNGEARKAFHTTMNSLSNLLPLVDRNTTTFTVGMILAGFMWKWSPCGQISLRMKDGPVDVELVGTATGAVHIFDNEYLCSEDLHKAVADRIREDQDCAREEDLKSATLEAQVEPWGLRNLTSIIQLWHIAVTHPQDADEEKLLERIWDRIGNDYDPEFLLPHIRRTVELMPHIPNTIREFLSLLLGQSPAADALCKTAR